MEKFIHRKVPSDEAIIIRNWNLEMIDEKNLEEPKPPEIRKRTSKKSFLL